jgi:hypothetical protein
MRAGEIPQAGAWIVVVVLVVLVSLVGQLSVIRLALGPHITVRESIVHGARRLFPYLGGLVVWLAPILIADSFLVPIMKADPAHPSVAAALAVIVISLAGLIIAVRLLLLSAVASAEEGHSLELLRRSWELTRGNWWRLFAFILVFAVGALALLWAAQAVIGVVLRLAFGDLSVLSVGGLILIIIGQLISGTISVILFVMLARLYVQRAVPQGTQASVPSTGI